MNTAIFWRLVWKEYRQQRALWAAIAMAGVIFQVAVLIYCSLNGMPDLSDKLFTVALSVPVLYSLGCGAALFAGEHEAETFSFQQSLPVTAGRVYFAKLAFGTVSTLLLFPVLWLLAFAMASWTLPNALWHLELWAGGLVAAIEVLIWAILGSLILRRVLPAAIVGGVTAVVLGYGALVLNVAFGGLFQSQANEYFSTLPLRTCFALVALAIVAKLGSQWFNETPIRWTSTEPRRTRSNSETLRREAPATWLIAFARLAWHGWRQGRAVMLSCVLGYVVLGTWMGLSPVNIHVFLVLLPGLAAIFGASAFAADQRQGQFQFFTEHGIRPRAVWLSRQLVWGCPLAIIAVAAASLQLMGTPVSHGSYTITSGLGLTILLFAVSQLCSILIRSGIVAVFTAGLCSVMLCEWVYLLQSSGVPRLVSALPLPFIFFWSSWLYAPRWIQQRQAWRARTVTAASIIAPLLCVVAATAAYRVYEIPAVELTFDSTILPLDDSPEACETAAMYQKADSLLRQRLAPDNADPAAISARESQWQEGIALFIATSQRKSCHFGHWGEGVPRIAFDGKQLTFNVLKEAEARVEEGDLEGAAELHASLLRLAAHFYQQRSGIAYRLHGMAVENGLYATLPAWADHESQTPERIREALTQLQGWFQSNVADWESSLTENRRDVMQVIALDERVLKDLGIEASGRFGIKTIGTLLFWERWRMSRLLDVYTATELQGVQVILARGPRIPPHAQKALPWDVRLTSSGAHSTLIRSTAVEAWLLTAQWPGMNFKLMAPDVVSWIQQYEVQRSVVQQQLALIAWRKEHGELPDSLRQLKGEPFDMLPHDPYTKEPFLYFPNGVEEEVWYADALGDELTMDGFGMSSSGSSAEAEAPPKPRLVRSEPFLWSPGELLRYAPEARRRTSDSPTASDFRDQFGNFLSDQNLLRHGMRYPISQAKQQPPDSSDDANALPNDE